MSQILNKLRDVDPNNSDAIKEALAPFFQQLSKHTQADCGVWLKALENVINRFPKYCMSHRGNIETYLAHFLDCTNYYVVIEAAKCAHALQQVRPTQEKTATAKSCWRDQMNTLCYSAQALLGAMFPNAVDIYHQIEKNKKDQPQLNSPLATAISQLSSTAKAKASNVPNKQAMLCNRLRNVFVFIQAMLVEIYPVAKPIRPQTILDVIVRALSVTSGNNANHNLTDVVDVKTQALRSIDALVACLGPNLIPFSPLIFRFVMQTLKWSSDNPSEYSSKVRVSAYNSLSVWLSSLHLYRGAERGRCWEDELAEHIIADITPYKHVVELKMGSQPTKHLSKKAKRKLANSMLQQSSISSHMPGEKNKVAISEEVNDEVAVAALECAEIFFTSSGIFMKPTTYKRFQERLVRECFSILSSPSPAAPSGRALYLLRALEAARRGAPRAAPHTQHCLQLYSVAINSEHRQIANFCSQALLDIRMHLHCSPPSLNFALEVQPDAQNIEEKKKEISKRNRAALEELLGADKVPKPTEKEEVITVIDEPTSKKLKIDETEKISLSSASSIEISDDSELEDSADQEVQIIIETAEEEHIHPDNEVNIVPIIEDVGSLNSNDTHDTNAKPGEDYTENNDITLEADIHNQPTQLPSSDIAKDISENKVDSTQPDNDKVVTGSKVPSNPSIYEAQTQLPLNVSNDDEEETPLSMEVAYDYPNTGTEKVTVLEKFDGDNLPSTNETDDIQITCGQVVKSSQDVDTDAKKSDNGIKTNIIKVNGNNADEKPIQNGDVTESSVVANIASKELNVEDMLADFVDEVNEDTQTQATQA